MMKTHGFLALAAVCAAVSAGAQTPPVQYTQPMPGRPTAGYEVTVLPAPKDGRGKEITGEVRAVLLTDAEGRVTDTSWSGEPALMDLAKQQKLPEKVVPVKLCRPVAEKSGHKTACSNAAGYVERIFVFPNQKGVYKYRYVSGRIDRPTYPVAAEENGEQGSVTVRIFVNTKGQVVKTELLKSSGHERLDRALLDVMSRAKMLPLIKDGRPRYVKYQNTIKFSQEKEPPRPASGNASPQGQAAK